MQDKAISAVKPGQPMTHDQKEALRKENAASSTEAHAMAAQARAKDERETPLVQTLADSIKGKLEALPPEPPANA